MNPVFQGGVLSPLYCSQRPVRVVKTSQLRTRKGGLQTTLKFISDSFSVMWFFIYNHPLLFFWKRKVGKRKLQKISLVFFAEKINRQKKTAKIEIS